MQFTSLRISGYETEFSDKEEFMENKQKLSDRLMNMVNGGYIYHFGKSTTPDQLDQTWVNCLNLFGVEYNA